MGLQDRDYMKKQGSRKNQRTTSKNSDSNDHFIKNLLHGLAGAFEQKLTVSPSVSSS